LGCIERGGLGARTVSSRPRSLDSPQLPHLSPHTTFKHTATPGSLLSLPALLPHARRYFPPLQVAPCCILQRPLSGPEERRMRSKRSGKSSPPPHAEQPTQLACKGARGVIARGLPLGVIRIERRPASHSKPHSPKSRATGAPRATPCTPCLSRLRPKGAGRGSHMYWGFSWVGAATPSILEAVLPSPSAPARSLLLQNSEVNPNRGWSVSAVQAFEPKTKLCCLKMSHGSSSI